MAHYRFFTKQVPEVPSPYGSLSSSISPAAIKDANTAVCRSQFSSCQAAIAKYASIVNDARSMVLGSLPNSPCVHIRRSNWVWL